MVANTGVKSVVILPLRRDTRKGHSLRFTFATTSLFWQGEVMEQIGEKTIAEGEAAAPILSVDDVFIPSLPAREHQLSEEPSLTPHKARETELGDSEEVTQSATRITPPNSPASTPTTPLDEASRAFTLKFAQALTKSNTAGRKRKALVSGFSRDRSASASTFQDIFMKKQKLDKEKYLEEVAVRIDTSSVQAKLNFSSLSSRPIVSTEEDEGSNSKKVVTDQLGSASSLQNLETGVTEEAVSLTAQFGTLAEMLRTQIEGLRKDNKEELSSMREESK